jgi:hypothetical protein
MYQAVVIRPSAKHTGVCAKMLLWCPVQRSAASTSDLLLSKHAIAAEFDLVPAVQGRGSDTLVGFCILQQ